MTSKLNVKAPTFTMAGNIDVFLKKLDNYFDMFASLTDKHKIKMLKSSLDDVTFEIVSHLPVPQEHTDDYSYMQKLCKQRFEPATSVNERRLQFRNERQGEDTLDQFYERLLKAATKAYPDITDESQIDANLCDQLIYGLKDTSIKQKLLEMPPANSREALATAKRLLAAKRYSSTTLKSDDTEELSTNYVHSRGQRGQSRGYRSRTYDGKTICFRCGGVNHMQANCTASIGTWKNRQQYTYRRGRSAPFRSRSGSCERFGNRSYDRPRSSTPSQFSQRNRSERSPSPRQRDGRWNSPDTNQPSTYTNRRRTGISRPTTPKELIGTLTNGKTNSALLYVRGYVNHILAYMLVDTGSMTSVISAKFYSCIKDSNCNLKRIDSEICGITNNRVKTLGICSLPIKFCNARDNRPHVKVEHSFHVVEGISVDCLIGLDFLSLYEGNVDILSRMLTLSTNIGMSKHALVEQGFNDQPVPVHVTEQYTIPARSQMLIKGNLSKELCDVYEDWCDVTQVAFTPSHQMHERFNLLVANCITSLSAINANVILHVMNTTNDDIILHSGIVCGTAEPCDDNNNVYYVNIDGYRLDAHDETDTALTQERHVHFADEVSSSKPTYNDEDSRPIYNKSELTKTKAWIKGSGLDINLTQFDDEQQTEILQLLTDYQDIFAKHDRDYGRCALPGCEYTIDLVEGARPVKLSPSRATPDKRKIIEKETRQMLADGIIRQSTGEWAAPVVLVKKKDGSWRYTINFKKLNDLTLNDPYPLPRIEDCLDSLAGSQWFSSLDLQAGYWQIPIKEEDQEKTGFCTHEGVFCFQVCPFGAKCAPSKFSKIMDTLLQGLKWSACLVYLDDVIAFSRRFNTHVDRLRQIFQRFRTARLKLKPKKCHLFKPCLEYLGHEVSSKGVSPLESKVRAIKEFAEPKTHKQLQSFLGLANFYRGYYKQPFAVLAKPLYQLLEKSNRTKFEWRTEHKNAFQALKDAISKDVCLAFPDPAKQYIVHCDACKFGVGCCLMQKQDDGSLRPISFASRTLNKREQSMSTYEQEALAILFALQSFHCYLYGNKFILCTDHRPLTYLKNNEQNPRITRWLLKIMEYDFSIQFIDGVRNVVADCLSRNAIPPATTHSTNADSNSLLRVHLNKGDVQPSIAELAGPLSTEEIIDAQQADVTLQRFRDNSASEETISSTLRTLQRRMEDIFENDGVLYIIDHDVCKIIIPPVLHNSILYEVHNRAISGHMGIQKTLDKFCSKFYWPGAHRIISDYVHKCEDCQMFKRNYLNVTPELKPITAYSVLELVAMDCVGPLVKSTDGSVYILTCIDLHTRWPEAYAIKDQQTTTIIKCLENFIATHGVPKAVLSDKGANFESKLMHSFLRAYNITKKRTSSYAPSTNGACERFNGTLMKVIAKYVSQPNNHTWSECLTMALAAIRQAPHAALAGLSPFEALYGRKPVTPIDINLPTQPRTPITAHEYNREFQIKMKEMREFINCEQEKEKRQHKERYDSKFSTEFKFNVGDKVYKNNLAPLKPGQNKKMQTKWVGPYVIEEALNDSINYKIRLLNSNLDKTEIIHQRRLKPAYMDDDEDDDDELSYESDQYEDANEYNDNDTARHTAGLSSTMPQAELTNNESEATHMTRSRSQKSQKQQKLPTTTTARAPLRERIERTEPLDKAEALKRSSPEKTPIKKAMLGADTQNTDTDIIQTSKRTSKTNLQEADSKTQDASEQLEELLDTTVKTTQKQPSDKERTNTQQEEQQQQEEQITLPRRSTRIRNPPLRYNPTFSVFHVSVSQTRKSEGNHLLNSACSIVMLLLFVFCAFSIAHPLALSTFLGPAKVCTRSEHSLLMFSVNSTPPNCDIERKYTAVKHVFVTPYFRKTISEHFPMYSCTIETEITKSYMSFFGAKSILGHESIFEPVNEHVCHNIMQAIKSNDLKQFNLIQTSPYTYVNSTSNIVSYKWCCKEVDSIYKKLMIRVIHAVYNYHTHQLYSPSVALHDCNSTIIKYFMLTCIVGEQTLVWDDDSYEECELIQGKTVRAEQRNNTIVSVEGQLAITLTGKTVLACKIQLQETHEHMYVFVNDNPNQPLFNLSKILRIAYQSSNEFLTMSYISQHLQDIIEHNFELNWVSICNIVRSQYFEMQSLAATSSSMVIRSLLQRDNITAQLRGDVLFVSPCTPILTYYFRNTTKCYNSIPIYFELNNHNVTNAFLKNNNLREITYDEVHIACNLIKVSYFKTLNNDYLQWNGKGLQHLQANKLHVVSLPLALTFARHDAFHLNADKIFDENADTIEHILDLDALSNKIHALNTLFSAVTSNTELDVESIKTIAGNLGTSVNDVIQITANSLSKFVPSARTLYIFFTMCVIVTITLLLIIICWKFDCAAHKRKLTRTFTSDREKIEDNKPSHSPAHIPQLTTSFTTAINNYENTLEQAQEQDAIAPAQAPDDSVIVLQFRKLLADAEIS